EKIQDIIWAINSGNDSWEQLLVKLHRYAADLLDSQGISYTLNIPQQISLPPLKMEERRNLWLIYKELITNIARHSHASHARISLSLERDTLHLAVQDDGIGFDPEQASHRNGLKNIKKRTEEMGGNWEVKAVPGKGARWRIEFEL
ncbi:MAG: sensor histidine kinase, partial [Calditrichia bacterium]